MQEPKALRKEDSRKLASGEGMINRILAAEKLQVGL